LDRKFVLLLALVMLAACGGGSSGAPPTTSTAAAPQAQQVQFRINAPPASSAAAKRRPQYLSAATQSMSLVVKQGSTTVLNETANLTVNSSGCTSTLASTICTLTVALSPGNYTATLSTYDQTGGAGNLLSSGQNVAFTVVAGANNLVPISLSGVPASFTVTAQNNVTTGSYATGFTIAGMQAQTFIVNALDADGNIIVGVGAPTFAIAESSGSGWAITNPTTTAPNTLSITPANTQNNSATLQITASFSDTTCSLAGAVCTATFGVKNDLPTLFVAACAATGCTSGSGAVLVYAPPYTGTPTTITSGIDAPLQLALDGDQNLYVANGLSGTIMAYATPYTSSEYGTLGSAGLGVLATSGGALVVTRFINGTGVFRWQSIFASTTSPSAGFSLSSLNRALPALDASGNIWMQTTANQVDGYGPPSYGQNSTTFVPSSTIEGIAVSPSDEVYVASDALVAVGPAGSTLTTYTLPSGSAVGVTYDPSGNAVAGTTSGVVILSKSASLISTITNGVSIAPDTLGIGNPQIVAVDNGYDIFVANSAAETITIYEPPYGSANISIPTGYTPRGVLLSP
jgi:YD repeat-containing protein